MICTKIDVVPMDNYIIESAKDTLDQLHKNLKQYELTMPNHPKTIKTREQVQLYTDFIAIKKQEKMNTKRIDYALRIKAEKLMMQYNINSYSMLCDDIKELEPNHEDAIILRNRANVIYNMIKLQNILIRQDENRMRIDERGFFARLFSRD